MVKLFIIKAGRSWYATDSGRYETPIMVIQIFYLALALGGGLLAWKQTGRVRQFAISIRLCLYQSPNN